MTDPTLRLPDTVFRAVLDLGELPLDAPPLPAQFGDPVLDADMDEESETVALYIDFEHGQLHMDFTDAGSEFHFHDGDGPASDQSPWSADDTRKVLDWSAAYYRHTLPLLGDLLEDAEEAADWHREGLSVFTRNFDGPLRLEIVEVLLEGEQLMLPWLGSGHIGHLHADDQEDSILLTWNPDHEDPETPIARSWLDPVTGEPVSEGVADVDWGAVGLPEAEVRTWFETFYLNHQVIGDPADLIVRAALNRIAGIG